MDYPRNLPMVQDFKRETALLVIATISIEKPASQPQLIQFFEYADRDDSELLMAIAANLDPNAEKSRTTLHKLATDSRIAKEVAAVALSRLHLIEVLSTRQFSYQVIREFRITHDDVWQAAVNGETFLKAREAKAAQQPEIKLPLPASAQVFSLEDRRKKKNA